MPPAAVRADDATAPRATPAAASGPQRAMRKLGLVRDIDFALHLPLRYEDETTVLPIAQAREGDAVQVEGVVRHAQVEQRPRRQLVVRIADASGELTQRFLHFYPSQQKQMAVGQRLRVRGETRVGFFGREMVHPAFRAVDEHSPLPAALTPVYPASAQLPQAYLRKAIAGALQRAPLAELLPPDVLPPGLPTLKAALELLHHPPPRTPLAPLEDRSHPAWQRLKFEELLAQQLSQLEARRARGHRLELLAPRLALAAAGQPGDLQAQRLEPLHQLAEVLLGEDLGRRHQRALPARADRGGRRQRRDDGLAGADVALQQPVHRLRQREVGRDLVDDTALRAGQRERQCRQQP